MRLASLCVAAALAALAVLPARVAGIDQITRRGKYLYRPDGTRFYIKGIAYQESAPTESDSETGGFPEPTSFEDPLALPAACTRDVPYLQQLGVNTIRVYSVDSQRDHSSCMRTFEEAGIYVILDLGLPVNGSINRAEPSWDTALLEQYLSTVEAFGQYDNVLAYNVANEVVTTDATTAALPFVRAAVRDVKSYLRSRGRSSLVAYSATDGPSGPSGRRSSVARYLSCGDEAEAVDLLGINSYSWCGNSNAAAAGFDDLASDFEQLPVATYFAEFGCATQGADARPWTEVAALFSPPMTDSFSGGVAFTYFPKDPEAAGRDYGIVAFASDAGNDGDVRQRSDFGALADQFRNATGPAAPPSPEPTTSTTCPSQSDSFLAAEALPPTPDIQLCQCMEDSAWSCLPTTRTAGDSDAIGTLFDSVCGLLDRNDAPVGCDEALTADGAAGVYGNWSMCAPAQRLSWAFDAYWQLFRNEPSANACNFDTQATLRADPTNNDADAAAATASCIAGNQAPTAVFTPQLPSSTASSSGGGSGGSGGGSGGNTGSGASTGGGPDAATAPALSLLAVAAAFGAGAFILL
ncbi:hypothetical protein FA09DRAFT_329478 [Tilletiopsis washingtonensis]|uniref:1,3-beta-glucanosyltransferase n=1 Tax=Tilletiopsis washingtonensis TaxID=58919 RepID=A0A316ZAT9_9BASI|nr:hypothetical protein FA09DRAFT_329478 [Tilletiopsis washingtonensis]PWN98416.1 hypothetical protein FA09DRAFT_329478 [Tilletiopsis washingtonensis]